MGKLVGPFGVIILLCSVAFFAAGPVIFNHSIEYDEAISLLVVAGRQSPDLPERIVDAGQLKEIFNNSVGPIKIAHNLRQSDVHPPLYFSLLAGWQKIFGKSIEAARFFSLLCTATTSIMLMMLIRSAGCGNIMAFMAPLFLLLSPLGIYVATTARPYALALFLIIASAWTAYESVVRLSLKERSPRITTIISLICGVLAGLAILSNYLAAISFVLLGLWILIFSIVRRSWRIILPFVIGAAALLAVSTWMLTAQLGSRPNQFADFEGLSLLLKTSLIALKQLAPYGFFSSLLKPYGSRLALSLMGLAIIFGAFSALADIKRETDRKPFWTLTILLGLGNIIGLVLIGALQNQSFTYSRYTYAAIPFLACLAAAGCLLKFHKWSIGLLLALPLLLLQIFWVYEVQVQLKTAQDWRTLARFAEQQLPLDETLIIIDIGHGRGVPSSMIYELPANAKVRMVSEITRPMKLFNDIKPYRYLLLVMSWQREGNRRLSEFINLLQNFGTHQRRRLFKNHSLMVKTGKTVNPPADMSERVIQ